MKLFKIWATLYGATAATLALIAVTAWIATDGITWTRAAILAVATALFALYTALFIITAKDTK